MTFIDVFAQADAGETVSLGALVVNAVIALVAIGAAIIAGSQATSARRAAEAADVHAKHAETSALAAERQASAAEKSNEHYEEELSLLREQVDILREQNERATATEGPFTLKAQQEGERIKFTIRNMGPVTLTDIVVRRIGHGATTPSEELFFPNNAWRLDRLDSKTPRAEYALREYRDGEEGHPFIIYYKDHYGEDREQECPVNLPKRAGNRSRTVQQRTQHPYGL